MKIGELAKASGLTTSSIRFYESAGIVAPPARVNGIRRYEPDVANQLRLVAFYRSCGVSIPEIATIFGAATGRRRETAHGAVRRRIDELETLIAHARSMQRRLRALQRCRCGGDRSRCVAYNAVA